MASSVRESKTRPSKMKLVNVPQVEKRLVEVAAVEVELTVTRLLITLGRAMVEEAKILMSCRAVVVELVVVA